MTRPACVGKVKLFDSTDPIDHMQARAICEACPILNDCRQRLHDAKAEWGYSIHFGPRGTWAGTLCAPKEKSRSRSRRAA